MITVRDATPEDAPAAAAVHIAAWQVAYSHVFPEAYLSGFQLDTWTANHLRNIHNSPPRHSLVAVGDPDQIVGFAHAGPARVGSPPSYDPVIGEVYAIYVRPDGWGTGAGRALMQTAIDRLTADGRAEIRVWCLKTTPAPEASTSALVSVSTARSTRTRRGRRLSEHRSEVGVEPMGVADQGGPHETSVKEVRYTLIAA
jgi:L-amino acid N-acyltransferase YncA